LVIEDAPTSWQDDWFDSAADRQTSAWRGVEAQHVVATMRLVDSLDEQAVLEQLLEAGKPALPPAADGLHYLLSTPFRYRSPHASRFRRAHSPGLWYGGETLRTAGAEVAYWRWRFLVDSAGLREGELLSQHTFFRAAIGGLAIDLGRPPWSAAAAHWTHPDDYTACQALGDAARARGIAWLRYRSVRDPGGHNVAVFRPQALQLRERTAQQTWHCRTTRDAVRLVHDDDRYEWRFEPPVARP
jgi:hypothetical protein